MSNRTNWRDCQAWRDENLPMNTTSNNSSKYFDISLTQFITTNDEYGDLGSSLKKMLEYDPNFILGQCLSQACQLSFLNLAEFKSGIQDMVKNAKKQENELNDREKMHVKAFEGFCTGDLIVAENCWQSIVNEYPTDILAIAFGFQTCFLTGNSKGLRFRTNYFIFLVLKHLFILNKSRSIRNLNSVFNFNQPSTFNGYQIKMNSIFI